MAEHDIAISADAAGTLLLEADIAAATARVRSLYLRAGFTAVPRSRVVKTLGPG